MPRPAARPKPPAQRSNSAIARPVRAEEAEFQFDSMDILVGVVLLVVIPVAAYVGLSLAGMPVSGGGGGDAIAALERKEQLAKTRSNVPLAKREFEAKFAWVRELLKNRVPEFLNRAKAENNPVAKGNWVRYGQSVCGRCKAVLETLDQGVRDNKEFLNDPQYAQSLRGQLELIANYQRELEQHDPFSAVRGK